MRRLWHKPNREDVHSWNSICDLYWLVSLESCLFNVMIIKLESFKAHVEPSKNKKPSKDSQGMGDNKSADYRHCKHCKAHDSCNYKMHEKKDYICPWNLITWKRRKSQSSYSSNSDWFVESKEHSLVCIVIVNIQGTK